MEVRARLQAERKAETCGTDGGNARGDVGAESTKGEAGRESESESGGDGEGEGESGGKGVDTDVDTDGVWVAMGGLVFDVTTAVRHSGSNICTVYTRPAYAPCLYSIFDGHQARGRAMLRSMSGGDGTRVVLRMWLAAYGGGAGEAARLEATRTVGVEALPTAQREYVASWAHHLAARYPCVGVLRETRADLSAEQGCTMS